jgi:hypothetical protein
MNSSNTVKRARGTRWCKTGIGFAVASVIAFVIGLGGARIGLLPPMGAFSGFGIGLLCAILSVLSTAIGIIISMGTAGDASAARSWGALAVSVIIVTTVLSQRPGTSGAPPINDISTDTNNPPSFQAIVPLRTDVPDYPGEEFAALQGEHFPDLVTLTIDKPTDEVFAAAEQIARDSGWNIVDADRTTGRIEATAMTPWIRFEDDVVIRIVASGSATRVDMRSKSRLGRGDMGVNARRIRDFLDKLKSQTAP